MNIIRNDRVVLIKEFESLKLVGQEFEVANILDNRVVLRDAANKIAVGAIDIKDFEQYFKKTEDVKGWTNWQKFATERDEILAFYRTNNKKVQVQIVSEKSNFRSEATCHKQDEFNLFFGIQVAYLRCINKYLQCEIAKCEHMIIKYEDNIAERQSIVTAKNSELEANNNRIKTMIDKLNRLNKVEE